VARGRILDQRERAERRAQLADDDPAAGDDAQTAEDKLDALALAAGGSVWSVFTDRSAAAANALHADALADALGTVRGRPLDDCERAAVFAGIGGYGSGPELAGALGISDDLARQRVRRGNDRMARSWPDAESMRAAMADARRVMGADDPAQLVLNADQRAAASAVDRVRRTLSRQRRMSGNPGTGGMLCQTGQWQPARTRAAHGWTLAQLADAPADQYPEMRHGWQTGRHTVSATALAARPDKLPVDPSAAPIGSALQGCGCAICDQWLKAHKR